MFIYIKSVIKIKVYLNDCTSFHLVIRGEKMFIYMISVIMIKV